MMNVLVDDCAGPDLWSIETAYTSIMAVPPIDIAESVTLRMAAGRVAARDLVSGASLPRFDQSAMDGYGIHTDDVSAGCLGPFKVDACIRAGGPSDVRLRPGRAVRLLTGAALPDGVGAVVMEERTDHHNDVVTLHQRADLGQNIRSRGEDIASDAVIAPAGCRLDARHVALLAACGHDRVEVVAPVRIGVMSNGDELVELGEALPATGIFDSNRPMLLALLGNRSVKLTDLGRVSDDREAYSRRLQALHCNFDLIITSGGVSGSDADHTVSAVRSAGGAATRISLAMKPGKPIAFGRIDRCQILCLPGNPVAAMVGGLLFARPLAARLAGSTMPLPSGLPARTADVFRHRPGRLEFVPVALVHTASEEDILVTKLGKGGSSRLAPLVAADGLAAIPAEAGDLLEGTSVRYFPFGGDFQLLI